MSCTATADHSARCRVAHALQTSNLRVPFLANPLDPDGARHMVALTIMWRVRLSRSRARQVDGSREKVHAESPREGVSKMTVLWLWGGELRVQHAYKSPFFWKPRVLREASTTSSNSPIRRFRGVYHPNSRSCDRPPLRGQKIFRVLRHTKRKILEK